MTHTRYDKISTGFRTKVYEGISPFRTYAINLCAWKAELSKSQYCFGTNRAVLVDIYFEDLLCELLPNRETEIMARKNSYTPPTFVRIELSTEHRKAFTKWLKDEGEHVLPRLFEILQDDYKMSVSHDGDRNTYIATFTRKGEVFPNTHCCLSARHDTFDAAIALLIYKHDLLCTENDWSSATDVENWG